MNKIMPRHLIVTYMKESIVFYHFTSKEVMESTHMKDTDIAFCRENEIIRLGNSDYLKFEWTEIPMSSITDPDVSNDKLLLPDSSEVTEGTCLLEGDINESTLII